MKTLKILFAAVIIAGFAINTYADDTNQDVEVAATIIAELSTTKLTDLNFGGVVAGTNATMNPINGNTANVGQNDIDAGFGKISIDGLSGRNITVGFDGIDLTGGDGGENIPYTPSIALGSDDENVGGLAVTSGAPISLPADESFLYVGGSISPDINQRAGVYTGEMTISIDYSSDI